MSGFVKEGREVVDKISKKRKENVQKIRKKGGEGNDEKEKEKPQLVRLFCLLASVPRENQALNETKDLPSQYLSVAHPHAHY